jgi:hypothetical protein
MLRGALPRLCATHDVEQLEDGLLDDDAQAIADRRQALAHGEPPFLRMYDGNEPGAQREG